MINGVLRVDCPTDTFRESVRKVVLGFSGDPPDFPGCDGLVSWRRNGQELELVVIEWGETQQNIVDTMQPRWVEVISLNLEEAFIEYTRGSKRSLPLFNWESNRVEDNALERTA